MHEGILKTPNYLFYNNKIKNCYEADPNFNYFHSTHSIMFINHDVKETGINEQGYYNLREVDICAKLTKFLIDKVGYS